MQIRVSHANHLQIFFSTLALCSAISNFCYLRRNDILSPASIIYIKELLLHTLAYCTVSSEQYTRTCGVILM